MTEQKEQGDNAAEGSMNLASDSEGREKLEQLKQQGEKANATQKVSTTSNEPSQAEEGLDQSQEKQAEKQKDTSTISAVWLETQERRELLKIYSYDLLLGLAIFVVFAVVFIVSGLVARTTGEFGILIKVVGWSISALGAICGISLAVRNAYDFLKLLIKNPPQVKIPPKVTSPTQQTIGQDTADEGRDE